MSSSNLAWTSSASGAILPTAKPVDVYAYRGTWLAGLETTTDRSVSPPPCHEVVVAQHAQISGSRYGSCPDFRRALCNDNDDTTLETKPLPGRDTDLHPSEATTNPLLPPAMAPSPSSPSPGENTRASTSSLTVQGSAAAAAAAAAGRAASAIIDDNRVAEPTPPSASSSSSSSFSFDDTATGGAGGGIEPLEMDDDRAGSTPGRPPLPSLGGATTSSWSSGTDARSSRGARNGGRIVRRGSRVGRGRRPSLLSDDDDNQQQILRRRSISGAISSCSSGRSSLRLVGSRTAGRGQSTGGGGSSPASPLGRAPRPPVPSHPWERRYNDDDGEQRRWRPAARQHPLLVRWSDPRLELIGSRPRDNSSNGCCHDSACDSGGTWACPSSGGGGGGGGGGGSVSTASYVDEEEEEEQRSARHGGPSPSSSDGHDGIDRYLSFPGVSPTSGPESANDRSSALRNRDGGFSSRFEAVGGGVFIVLPQEKAMLPPSGNHSRRNLQVLNLVDVNARSQAVHRTPAAGDAGAGTGTGAGTSKRTPEERAYLRRAGLDDFSSTASSVGSCPFVHATAASRLAAAVKTTAASAASAAAAAASAAAAAAENTESMPGLVTPTSPAAGSLTSFDTPGGGGLPPPAFEPLPARRRAAAAAAALGPPKDNVSFLYSWPSLPDSVPAEETFRAAGATPASAAVKNNGDIYSHVGDHYGSGAAGGGEKGDSAPGKGGRGRGGEEVVLPPSAEDASERSSNSPNCSNFGSDSYSGSDRSVWEDEAEEEGGWVGEGEQKGGSGKIEPSSMFPRQEGGIWIDVDGTPMGEILPAPRTGVASSLLLLDSVGSGRNHHPRHPRSSTGGLYPGKKPIAEAGGLGGFLEEASSAYVSAAAAAAASSKAWASDALWALVSCVGGEEERGQQEMMSPPILPYPGYMRPEEEEELSVWGGVTSTE